MYNLSRKSIKIVAGLSLLLFFSCKTTLPVTTYTGEIVPYTIDNLFSNNWKNLLYVNSQESREVINTLLDGYFIDKATKNMLLDSDEFFLGVNSSINNGFDLLLTGDISRGKIEFGLFWSLAWRGVKGDGYVFWENKNGLKLAFLNNNTIVVSTKDIKKIIDKNIQYHSYIAPESSVLFIMPVLEKEDIARLTKGFIKGDLNRIEISLKKLFNDYKLRAIIGVDGGKTRGFSQLLKLFFKVALSKSDDPELVRISSEMEISANEDSVYIENIVLSDRKIVQLLNNLLVINGETDK